MSRAVDTGSVHAGIERSGGEAVRCPVDQLRVFLLGPFAARLGPATQALPVLNKAQDLLVLLFLAPGQLMLREAVTDTLWPDVRADSSRKLMRQALWHIHRAADAVMDERLVVADGDALRINTDREVWVDVSTFTNAVRVAQSSSIDDTELATLNHAADLYRGPLHVGCLDEWCIVPRARLEDRCLTLLDRLSMEHERRHDLDGAIAWSQRVLDIEPAHERSHRRLMRLYQQAGDRTRAIRQLQQCRIVLERELGVRPDARTEELGSRILSGSEPRTDGPASGGQSEGLLRVVQQELVALRRSVDSIGAELRRTTPPR